MDGIRTRDEERGRHEDPAENHESPASPPTQRRGRDPALPGDAESGARRDRPGAPRKDDDHRGPEGTPSAPERRRWQGRPSPRAVPERPPPYRKRAGIRPE